MLLLGAVMPLSLFFINTASGEWLPKYEGVVPVFHVSGVLAFYASLVHLGPYADSAIPLTTYNGGDWPTDSLSLVVGLSGAGFTHLGVTAQYMSVSLVLIAVASRTILRWLEESRMPELLFLGIARRVSRVAPERRYVPLDCSRAQCERIDNELWSILCREFTPIPSTRYQYNRKALSNPLIWQIGQE